MPKPIFEVILFPDLVMGKMEASPVDCETQMPIPGTLDHFEWLAALEVSEDPKLNEAENFLTYTQAATSFARFTRAHRQFVRVVSSKELWPLNRDYRAEFDSRRLGLDPEWRSVIRSSIETNPEMPAHANLIIHGRPNPVRGPNKDYTYDLLIPVKAIYYFDPSYDSTRPIEASFSWREYDKIKDRYSLVYNELSSRRDDGPAVLIRALKEAAYDLYNLFEYSHGSNGHRPRLEPSPPELAPWYSGYLDDQADEFMTKP